MWPEGRFPLMVFLPALCCRKACALPAAHGSGGANVWLCPNLSAQAAGIRAVHQILGAVVPAITFDEKILTFAGSKRHDYAQISFSHYAVLGSQCVDVSKIYKKDAAGGSGAQVAP